MRALALTVTLLGPGLGASLAAQEDINEFGRAFNQALKKNAQKQLGTRLKGEFTVIQDSDFPWFWDLEEFNIDTWRFIDGLVTPGEDGAVKVRGVGSFSDTYANQVLSDLMFKFSKEDQEKKDAAGSSTSASARQLVRQYEDNLGKITSDKLTKAAGAMGQDDDFSKLDYIIDYKFAYLWTCRKAEKLSPLPLAGVDLNNLPRLLQCRSASAGKILNYISNYLGDANKVLGLFDRQNQAGQLLGSLRNNARDPDENNGGLKTSDDKFRPDYRLPAAGLLLNQLQGDNAVSLSMNVVKESGHDVLVNIEGGGGATIPLPFFFSASGEASAAFNLSSFQASSNQMKVKMTWSGVTDFDITPTTYAGGTGWYNGKVLSDAVKNQSRDWSGIHFNSTPPVQFGPGGDFARISHLVISQYPSIEITTRVSDINRFSQSLTQKSKWGVSFLGLPLGSGSNDFYEATWDHKEETGEVTIRFQPGDITNIGADSQKVAYVLGGVVEYPGLPVSEEVRTVRLERGR